MNYWRMAFRIGVRGPEVWPDCYDRGIAAITYWPGDEPLGNLSDVSREEYEDLWRRRDPEWNKVGRASLRKFRYEMEKDDIIYVKQGQYIVGKGVVKSDYEYDPKILKGWNVDVSWEPPWEHYREVDWLKDFQKFKCVVGADQHTVLELNRVRLNKIREMENRVLKEVKVVEVKEGQRYISEVTFRARNRALIEAKKANSDYRCEVCKMRFKEVYGGIGEGYIIAHHVNPIGSRKSASKTTLDDIALVCANCHEMLHIIEPPMSISELRHRIKRRIKC